MKRLKNKLLIVALIILSLLPTLALFHIGLPWTHDGQDHVARIANFYKNLQEGILIPRWGANLNWGYGHPVLEFLYPLPSYFASFFHSMNFSLVDSTKIVFGMGMFLSLISMYLWLSQFLGEGPSLLGAVLYAYAPYRFVDLYVRGDIGENLAFAFIPLVLYFIFKIYKKQDIKYVAIGGVSLGCLILAHNAISLILMPFIIFYGLFLLYISKNKKNYFKNFLGLILLGFGLSFFFWAPGLLEAKYTLRDIVTKNQYLSRFVDFKSLVYSPWVYGGTGQFTQQIGIIQWIGIIFSPLVTFVLLKRKEKKYILIIALLIYTLFAIFLMLPVSNFIWTRIMILQNFQFPWRFLVITVFSGSILGAFVLEVLPKKIQLSISIALVVLIVFFSLNMMAPKGYLLKPAGFYEGIYPGTTDTGESSPIWSIRFMESYPKAHLQTIDGKAKIIETKRTSTEHDYQIQAKTKAAFLENTLYFPGWTVTDNNKVIPIEFQSPRFRGQITFLLEPGVHKIKMYFEDTKIRQLSDLISFISILVLFGLIGIKLRRSIK